MSHPNTLEEAEARIRGGHERGGGGKGGDLLSLFRRGGGGDKESEARGQYNVTTEHMQRGYSSAKAAINEIKRMQRSSILGVGYSEAEEYPAKVAMLIRQAGSSISEGARGEVGRQLTLVSNLKIDAKPGEISKALRAVENEVATMIVDPGGTNAGALMGELGHVLRELHPAFDHEEYMKKDGRAQEAYCRDHGQYPDGKPYRVATGGVTTTKTGFWGRLFGGGTSGGETSSAWDDWGNRK